MSELHHVGGPWLWIGLTCTLSACGANGAIPSSLHDRPIREIPEAPEGPESAPVLPTMDGNLGTYLGFAIEQNPRVRAAFESWRSAMYATGKSGRLPEPTINFGYFVRSVETRVGPQIYNISLSQTLPWPGKLAAEEDGARERARAAALVTDAEVLTVRRDLAEAYFNLWLITEEHRLRMEHDVLLEALAGAVRGRLQTGNASLAELNQVDLSIARHHDHRGAHEQGQRRASARLVAVLGAAPTTELLVANEPPAARLPSESDAAIYQQARRHPLIDRLAHLAESETHSARAQAVDRYPRFMLGANLIGIGEAAMEGVADSGKDAVVISAGLSLPLWGSSYADAEQSARAAAAAHRAMGDAGRRQAEAAVAAALADLRDSYRRIGLYESTLIPQAQSTFEAVVGGYQVKSSTVADAILAQRDLIELQIEHARARAEHAKAWAQLEFWVGAEVASGDIAND